MKKLRIFMALFAGLIFLGGCQFGFQSFVPQDGVWYCEELQLYLSYEEEVRSVVIINGEMIICANETDSGTNDIMVLCQEPDNSIWYTGELMFSFECDEFDQREMSVTEKELGVEYSFVCLSDDTVQKLLEEGFLPQRKTD